MSDRSELSLGADGYRGKITRLRFYPGNTHSWKGKKLPPPERPCNLGGNDPGVFPGDIAIWLIHVSSPGRYSSWVQYGPCRTTINGFTDTARGATVAFVEYPGQHRPCPGFADQQLRDRHSVSEKW